MRIVHLEAGRHAYGGVRQVAYLIEGLARQGIDNVLIAARGSAIAKARLPADVVELSLGGDLDFWQTGRIANALAARPGRLVHVHSRRGADLYGAWAARRVNCPAIVSRRVDSTEPAAWLRFKLARYDRIVAISRAIETDLIERVGMPAAAVTRIPSAVDTTRYRPGGDRSAFDDRFAVPADAIVLGCVAQLIERKGHDCLLRAFAALGEERGARQLVLFGRGPLEAMLRRQAAELGVADRVTFAGFVEDLDRWLPSLDLLVHPAEREGLGVAVLEACAAGVPVVAAAVGGLPDIIDDGVDGCLVPAGDVGALRAAIERVLANDELRVAISERARRKVERDFSISRMVEATLGVYREVLSQYGHD